MHTIRDEFFTPTIALNARFAVLTLQSVSLAYHFEHRLGRHPNNAQDTSKER
jgi:hypothetical protein